MTVRSRFNRGGCFFVTKRTRDHCIRYGYKRKCVPAKCIRHGYKRKCVSAKCIRHGYKRKCVSAKCIRHGYKAEVCKTKAPEGASIFLTFREFHNRFLYDIDQDFKVVDTHMLVSLMTLVFAPRCLRTESNDIRNMASVGSSANRDGFAV